MIESIAFDEKTHKYTAIIDGQKRYPVSVSEVCRGGYGYISPAAEAAMKRGREVHDDIATRLLSGEEPKKIINKFARFSEDLYTVHVEHPICAPFGELLVAGTPDLIAETQIGRLGCHRLENGRKQVDLLYLASCDVRVNGRGEKGDHSFYRPKKY